MSCLAVCLNPTLQKTLAFGRFKAGEVNRCREYRLDASGKGINVTRVLVQLGCPAVHLTHAGGRQRELFLSLAARDGLSVEAPDSGSEIRHCYTIVDRAGPTTTELVEEAEPVSPETEGAVRRRFDSLLDRVEAVIISGTKAAGFSEALYPELVERAGRAGKKVLLDLRGADLVNCLPFRPLLIKPNLAEFVSTFLGAEQPSERIDDEQLLAAVKDKMAELAGRYGCMIVLTRGPAGALWRAGLSWGDSKAEKIRPLNTTGSGDAFTAGFAAAWLEGAGLEAALARGHRCAARNAELLKPGSIL